MVCYICKKELNNNQGLASHVIAKHNFKNVQEYYDLYLKCPGEDICNICDCFNKTEFKNVLTGYEKYCHKHKYIPTKIITEEICEYGCGQVAKYELYSGKKCCSKSFKSCPEIIRKSSEGRKGQIRTKEQKLLLSKAHIGQVSQKKGKNYKEIYGEKKAKKVISKMSNAKKLTLKKIKEKYPLLFKVEEFRFNKNTNEIQVHCKNHNCPNSKEKGGWFTPTYTQIYERHRALNFDIGYVENNFYCSKKCKQVCPLYGTNPDQLLNQKRLYTDNEYQIFREEVLKRDNYKCIYCGEKAEHIHHTRPQKLEPFFSLDPDYAISCCKNCHYKYGHGDKECNTGYLANTICK